jgi:membrane fusion protein, heavy metal efflux system
MAKQTRLQTLARLSPQPLALAAAALLTLGLQAGNPAFAQAAATPAHKNPPLAAGPASTPPSTANLSSPRAASRPAVGCLIGPERVADIGTAVTGLVESITVDRGDVVRQGQPLVWLASEVERAGSQAAQVRAGVDADIRAAEANVALARQRHARVAGLVAEAFVTPQAVEQALAEREVAEQKLEQARAQKTVLGHEAALVRAQLGQRTLKSPISGVVIERFVNAGERAEDKPLLRVAMLDPLRVELVMPANRWASVNRGDQIAVLPELPGASSLLASVTHIDKIIDAASNTFRVRLSLPNPGHKLPAGARCKVDAPVALPAPGGASAPAASSLPTAATPPTAAPARRV